MSETFYNIIDKNAVVPANATWFESHNPADMRDSLGRFVESGPEAIAQAAESARAAAAEWARHARAEPCNDPDQRGRRRRAP